MRSAVSLGANPPAMEARAKTMIPWRNIRIRPYMSPRRPPARGGPPKFSVKARNPVEMGGRDVKRSLHAGQGHVDDGVVEDQHQLRGGDDE